MDVPGYEGTSRKRNWPSRRGAPAALVTGYTGVGIRAAAAPTAGPGTQCARAASYPAETTPVAFWSTEARCAILPRGPNGIFGTENLGTNLPGDAAVYMGIAHV